MSRRLGWMAAALILLTAAAYPAEALETLRQVAIQHHGRVKPFESFAREALWLITGRTQWRGQDPTQTVFSIVAEPERWQGEPLIAVPYGPLREALGLARTTTHVSYNDLIATRRLMRMLPPIVEKQGRDEKLTMLEQETMDAFDRFVLLNRLFEQELALVPPQQGQGVWQPILQQAQARDQWQAVVTAAREGPPEQLGAAVGALTEALQAVNPSAYPPRWRLQLEVGYHRARPFVMARFLYLAAAVALILALAVRRPAASAVGMGLLGAGFVVHGAGIVTRIVLGGRPPVSNFYETMLWIPFVAMALAIVFERIYRANYFGVAAGLLAALVLALADQLPLDPSVAPVVAVLRSTLWLSIHVLTIVASYGALALATVLAHLYGGLLAAKGPSHPALPSLSLFLYRCLQVGIVLLTSGIMLGAVWANASWGRYWGWDPKETWALITLIWFLAVLHGRFAGWLKETAVALATIGGFFLLLMTYYGVSFYLVGLHSYAGGHAKPLPPLLVGYLVAELAFMALVVARRRMLY